MAHKILKPYSFLLYFLGIVTFFFIGLTLAGIVEAGKNQGLAGGAIVFGYGVVGAVIGLIVTLFIASTSTRKIVFRLNIVLALCIVLFYAYFHIKFLNKQKSREEEKAIIQQPRQPTSSKGKSMAMLYPNEEHTQTSNVIGLGMFSPNILKTKALYFYGNLNLEKSIMDHSPTDSITFKLTENHNIDITTAPPWLAPEHLKLDYGIIYFKVISVSEDFLEVIVNTTTQQTAYIDKQAGNLKYWPEFLLSINSVEFLNSKNQKVHSKPLEHSSTVNSPYSFMRPSKVKQNWIYVLLVNDGFETVGKGWIKWKENGKLLIKYSLLS